MLIRLALLEIYICVGVFFVKELTVHLTSRLHGSGHGETAPWQTAVADLHHKVALTLTGSHEYI